MILGNVFSNFVSLYKYKEIHYFPRSNWRYSFFPSANCDIDDIIFFKGPNMTFFSPSVNIEIENMFFFRVPIMMSRACFFLWPIMTLSIWFSSECQLWYWIHFFPSTSCDFEDMSLSKVNYDIEYMFFPGVPIMMLRICLF